MGYAQTHKAGISISTKFVSFQEWIVDIRQSNLTLMVVFASLEQIANSQTSQVQDRDDSGLNVGVMASIM